MSTAKDPVCGMDVDPKQAKFKTVHKGEIYYFCSEHCLNAFRKDPEHYLKHGPVGMPTE